MRLLWIFLALAALVLLTFGLWGDGLESMFSEEGAREWLEGYGRWAWFAGLVLLILDLFLPIPGTVIMSALGYLYGPWLGGAFAATGSVLSGLLAYGLCRSLGHRAAEWIAGKRDLERGERLFANVGGWFVALSRWLPILPEVVACMAGLTRMPFRIFFAALCCGSIPLGFAFAAIGEAWKVSPGVALGLSAGIPVLLWLVMRPIVRRHS